MPGNSHVKMFLMSLGCVWMMYSPLQAQTIKGSQQWVQYYASYSMENDWSLTLDGGYRWITDLPKTRQYIARLSANKELPNHFGVGFGVASLGAYVAGEYSKGERRAYLELSQKSKWSKFSIQHRLRSEERFFRTYQAGTDNYKTDFRWRWRYRLLAVIHVADFRKGSSLSFNLGDEIMVNTNKDIGHQFFDQNRFLFGPSVKINDKLTTQLTGSLQYASTNSADIYHLDMVWWLGIVHRLN